ncbi:probable CCR4-associated factor 1 homolog 11 [Sorghum bicolor]|uniref:Uncharacterized protein n=1 Tax=Sorghum bicolor TaxID=4558 RepID=C5Y580_SORBI|nr:probable CCR4-associated factor 1 homolog 11 [Sorghum bicolor]EES09326.2 hypothetical protein SORBI_3005G049100 [Sorghum bicolor]|eukprot:XP_021317592.1 probable CCR4-associated factor 1 homolog 11 [Sorghum bicolor]
MSRTSAAHQQQQHQWRRRRRQHGQVFVRQVTAANLVHELSTIRGLLERYPYVTVHAEHHGAGGDEEGNNLPPGVRIDDLPAASRYALAKVDVDSSVPYSQLGITLCDANGKLPVLPAGTAAATGQSVWQVGLHDRDSVSVSGSGSGSGGASSLSMRVFAHALFATRVVSSAETAADAGVTWVAYGGLYHLGFLLKVLTGGARLPDTKEELLASLRAYLGDRVVDARYVAARLGLEGALTRVASLLGAPAATEPWQAGERSLVACQVFMRLKGLFFAWDDTIDVHAGCIHGLQSTTSSS